MRSDKAPSAGMSSRQKITIAIFVVVFIIVVWLAVGLFRTPEPGTATTRGRAALHVYGRRLFIR